MAKLFNKFFGQYKTEAMLLLGAIVAWKLWGFFSGLSDIGSTISDKIAAAAANAQQGAKEQQEKAKIKAVNASATAHDLAVFEDDAEALAQACGGKSFFFNNALNTNWQKAYEIAKRYSRLQYRVVNHKIVVVGVRKASLQLLVLAPFYKTATDGRNLQADLDMVMTYATKDAQAVYKKYIK